MRKILYILFIIAAVWSCTPPEIGYISDDIHALEDTVFVPRGVFRTSAAPNAEGSTYPLKWVITEVTDEDGNPTDDLFEEHEILIWKESFNGDTDTTLALAQAKLELSDEPTLLINSVSGEMAFTQASKFVTDRDIYKVNVNVSNVKGERQLNNFTVIKLQPFQPVEFPVEMRSGLRLGKSGGGWDVKYMYKVVNGFDDKVPGVLDGTDPYITVVKISDEPAFGFKAKMTICDSYGTPISPDKITFYPSGASYLQNYHDNSVETTEDATSTYFNLPAPPFPQFARTYSGNSSYLMYYLSTADAFELDVPAYEAALGAVDPKYIDPVTGKARCSAYIRWGIKINDSGTWDLKMKIPYTKVKN